LRVWRLRIVDGRRRGKAYWVDILYVVQIVGCSMSIEAVRKAVAVNVVKEPCLGNIQGGIGCLELSGETRSRTPDHLNKALFAIHLLSSTSGQS
jgi:hypothetical protein